MHRIPPRRRRLELWAVPPARDDHEAGSGNRIGKSVGRRTERRVQFSDQDERRGVERTEGIEAICDGGQLCEHRRVHGRRAGEHLRLGPLPIPGPLGTEPLVRRVVEGVGSRRQQFLDHSEPLGPGELDSQGDEILVEPLDPPVMGVHQHEAPDATWALEDHELGHHAPHRMAHQIKRVPPEVIDQRERVGGERREVVGSLVGRLIASAVTSEVGRHHMEADLGQRYDFVGEVLLATGEPVQQQEGPTTLSRGQTRQVDPGKRNVQIIHRRKLPARGAARRENGQIVDEGDTDQRGQRLRVVARVIVSVALLAVLVWRLPDVGWNDLAPSLRPASFGWFGAAAVTLLAAFALSTLRWRVVLSALADPPPYRRMLGHFLAGQFVSNVLPTSFGGDVVRIARLGADLDDRPKAFASVTIERLTGWLVLPAITLVSLGMQPDLARLGSASRTAIAVAAGTLVALLGILATASNRRFTAGAETATGWRQFLGAVHLGVDALRRRPVDALSVIGVGVAFQILQCLVLWMAATALGLDEVTIGVALAFFPAAAVMQNLPIGLGGLGVREGAFVLFFGAVGAPQGQSITLGLTIYLLTVATSALGAPAFALGGHRRSPRSAGPGTGAHSRFSQDPHPNDVARPSRPS